jgi:hypothetical protein
MPKPTTTTGREHRDVLGGGVHPWHYARGWCAMHYKRWLRTGLPNARRTAPTARWMAATTRPSHAAGATRTTSAGAGTATSSPTARAARAPSTAAVDAATPVACATPTTVGCAQPVTLARTDPRRDRGGLRAHGYWVVPVAPEERWLVEDASAAEHRLVMARLLGRPSRATRASTTSTGCGRTTGPENLELWSSSHPSGQRVQDKVAWALQILARYRDLVDEPELGTRPHGETRRGTPHQPCERPPGNPGASPTAGHSSPEGI